MFKTIKTILALLMTIMLFSLPSMATKDDVLNFTPEEKEWIKAHQSKPLTLGFDAYSGLEYFTEDGIPLGYINDLEKVLERDLGVEIQVLYQPWSVVYEGLQEGSVDILFGANETESRKEIMLFTKPLYQYYYTLLTNRAFGIQTIGEIDEKKVGYLEGDFAIDDFSKKYQKISFKRLAYRSQDEGLEALRRGEIQAFLTSGGETIYDYLNRYSELQLVSTIETISSDMTLSTRKSEPILASLLNKEVDKLLEGEIKGIINQARVEFFRKILNLTPAEKKWIKEDGTIVMGVTKDYLPFELMMDGKYVGISGTVIRDIEEKLGLNMRYEYDDFDRLYEKLEKHEIDILNIAKTEEREKLFNFSVPYIMERDLIYGKRGSQDVIDIYGLEGQKVVVVKGYYQKELLEKNLTHVELIEVKNIQDAIQMVHDSKADYLIENSNVIRYYSEEMDIFDVVEKGKTNTDTYLYYGINKEKPEIQSIFNKIIPLLNMDQLIIKGYDEIPREKKKDQLLIVIIILVVVLIGSVYLLYSLFTDLVNERSEKKILQEREAFLYKDSLTGLYNRNYLNDKLFPSMDSRSFPQSIIVCDVNSLKEVNDVYGHSSGDFLLKSYSDLLAMMVPQGTLIRLGGDEFLVLIFGKEAHEVDQILNGLKEKNQDHYVVDQGGNHIRVWAAYGLSTRKNTSEGIEEMIRIADDAMYLDKYFQKKID